jgi:hypothetical protein
VPFLTPNNAPDNQQVVRRIVLPADNTWTSVFDGHILELTRRWNWEKYGDLTAEDTAQWFADHYREFTTDYKETPYADDTEELDGSPEYPWYEQLYDWVIAGFLAYTFTPLAAITYNATVPKLRVAFRTNNIGALFRVLINGVEVWTGDSYGPITDVIEQVFDTSSLETPYVVRVEHAGTGEHAFTVPSKLEYIRNEAVAQMVATILRSDPAGCGIQWSTDNGGTWSTIDLSECITSLATDAANSAIQQAIDDKKIAQPGGQPGGQPSPAPGQCTTYHVELNGNNQWMLPSPLGFGDSVTVSNVTGAWSDNGYAWWCPDGETFVLGACSEIGKRHDEGDVLNPGAYHMELVMKAGETWYQAPLTTFTQNSGTTPLDVMFQANDGTLPDNTGSISFDATVCTSDVNYWSQTFDFSQGELGWASDTRDGSGWGAVYSGGQWSKPQYFCMYYTTPISITQSTITRYQCTGTYHYGSIQLSCVGNAFTGLPEYGSTPEGPTLGFELTNGGYLVMQRGDSAGVSVATITFEGTGNNPFA